MASLGDRFSLLKSLKTNIWMRTLVFTTEFLQSRMALTADTVRVKVAWGMVPVDCIPPHRQGLDNRTLWLLIYLQTVTLQYNLIDRKQSLEFSPCRLCPTRIAQGKLIHERTIWLTFWTSQSNSPFKKSQSKKSFLFSYFERAKLLDFASSNSA